MQAVQFGGAKRLQCCLLMGNFTRFDKCSSVVVVVRKFQKKKPTLLSVRSSSGLVQVPAIGHCHHNDNNLQLAVDGVRVGQQIREHHVVASATDHPRYLSSLLLPSPDVESLAGSELSLTPTTAARTSCFLTSSAPGQTYLASTCLKRPYYYHQQQRQLSSRQRREKVAVSKRDDPTSPTSSNDGVEERHNIRPRNVDKWMLVYTKTYPDRESIPDVVPTRKMATSRDKLRAQLAIALGVVCLACMFFVSVFASKARKAGTGVTLKQYTNQRMGDQHWGDKK